MVHLQSSQGHGALLGAVIGLADKKLTAIKEAPKKLRTFCIIDSLFVV
jgi:hypothetical protein